MKKNIYTNVIFTIINLFLININCQYTEKTHSDTSGDTKNIYIVGKTDDQQAFYWKNIDDSKK